MFPPRSFEFNVTIADPSQTRTNTCANCGPPSASVDDDVDPWRIVAMKVQRIRGPHKSHSFSKVNFSFGYNTCVNLTPTARMSRSWGGAGRDVRRVRRVPGNLNIPLYQSLFNWLIQGVKIGRADGCCTGTTPGSTRWHCHLSIYEARGWGVLENLEPRE